MNKISSSLDDIKDHYDAIVIGSGYGGGVSASRIARAGKSVCLLERGREFMPGEFPDTLLESNSEMQIDTHKKKIGSETALMNFHLNDDISVLVGCGLGGTSLINANVALRVDERVYHDGKWPKAFVDDIGHGLENGYKRAEEMLKPTTYPDTYPPHQTDGSP